MPALAPASQPLDYDKVKAHFEKLQLQRINQLKNSLNALTDNIYTPAGAASAAQASLTTTEDYYRNLNNELSLLKVFQAEHSLLVSPDIINELYHPDALELYNSRSFDRQRNQFVTNELFLVLRNINKLNQTTLNSTREHHKFMKDSIENVCAQAIQLTVDIIIQKRIHYQREDGQLLFRNLFDKLANTLHAITHCIENPQDEKQYQPLFAFITEMEKTIEPTLTKFARLRPALASFLGLVTLLAGVALFVGGLALTVISPILAVAVAIPGLLTLVAGTIAFAAPILMSNDNISSIHSNKVLGEQNEITAKSMRSLVSGSQALFAKPKETPVSVVNTAPILSTRQAFLGA